uniref:Uncharacterized protein n=1 Tax=Anguilla anguilla TaxID=7936 RepID=A0A0E9RHY9_ANGAN
MQNIQHSSAQIHHPVVTYCQPFLSYTHLLFILLYTCSALWNRFTHVQTKHVSQAFD